MRRCCCREPPPQKLRPLSEMIAVYHNSVGRNTVMELDFGIDRTGRVDPTHAALYATFGGWIKSCYGPSAVVAQAEASLTAVPEHALWVPVPQGRESGQRGWEYVPTSHVFFFYEPRAWVGG